MNKVAQDWVSDEVTRSNCFAWMDLNCIINSLGKKMIDIIMLCQEWHENYITDCLIGQYCYDVTDRIFDRWISHQTGVKSPFQWHNHLLGKKTKGRLDSLLASMVVMRVSCAIYWKKNLLYLGKLIIYPCFKKAFLHCIECNIKINVICVKIVLSFMLQVFI